MPLFITHNKKKGGKWLFKKKGKEDAISKEACGSPEWDANSRTETWIVV